MSGSMVPEITCDFVPVCGEAVTNEDRAVYVGELREIAHDEGWASRPLTEPWGKNGTTTRILDFCPAHKAVEA